jgi:hypothetical protein
LAVEGSAESCGWRRVAVADEISAWYWRGNAGWRQERTHELSKPIAGLGHSRGWQSGSKVSTMTIRPPQQGQAVYITVIDANKMEQFWSAYTLLGS